MRVCGRRGRDSDPARQLCGVRAGRARTATPRRRAMWRTRTAGVCGGPGDAGIRGFHRGYPDVPSIVDGRRLRQADACAGDRRACSRATRTSRSRRRCRSSRPGRRCRTPLTSRRVSRRCQCRAQAAPAGVRTDRDAGQEADPTAAAVGRARDHVGAVADRPPGPYPRIARSGGRARKGLVEQRRDARRRRRRASARSSPTRAGGGDDVQRKSHSSRTRTSTGGGPPRRGRCHQRVPSVASSRARRGRRHRAVAEAAHRCARPG